MEDDDVEDENYILDNDADLMEIAFSLLVSKFNVNHSF